MREWFWYAVLYSFLGFLLEVAYARAVRAEKQDRKCFYFLPLCPVYGLGALLILAPAPLLAGRPLLLALWSGAAATGAEYAMSLFYEKLFRASFWDYTALPWNLGGRVCLAFSTLWPPPWWRASRRGSPCPVPSCWGRMPSGRPPSSGAPAAPTP